MLTRWQTLQICEKRKARAHHFAGPVMRVRLELVKGGRRLHQGTYEIDDNASFGAACADVWVKLREACAERATSIGALMDTMHESVLDELNGAEIRVERL